MDEGVFVLNPHKLDDYGLEAWPPTAFYAPKQRPIVPLHGASGVGRLSAVSIKKQKMTHQKGSLFTPVHLVDSD